MEASSRRILNQGVKGLGIWRARRAWAVGCGLKKIKNTDPVNWALKVEQHRHHGRKTSKKWSPPIQSRKVYVLKNLTYLRWVTILVRSRRKPRKTGWNQTMEDFEFWRFRVGKHSWGVRFWAGNDNRLDRRVQEWPDREEIGRDGNQQIRRPSHPKRGGPGGEDPIQFLLCLLQAGRWWCSEDPAPVEREFSVWWDADLYRPVEEPLQNLGVASDSCAVTKELGPHLSRGFIPCLLKLLFRLWVC